MQALLSALCIHGRVKCSDLTSGRRVTEHREALLLCWFPTAELALQQLSQPVTPSFDLTTGSGKLKTDNGSVEEEKAEVFFACRARRADKDRRQQSTSWHFCSCAGDRMKLREHTHIRIPGLSKDSLCCPNCSKKGKKKGTVTCENDPLLPRNCPVVLITVSVFSSWTEMT